MKEVNKICITVFICFMIWQINNIAQLNFKRIKLNECMDNANLNYSTNWDSSCKLAGKKSNCTLSIIQSQHVEDIRQNSFNMCIEVFKYNN